MRLLGGKDEQGPDVRSSHGRYTDFQAFMSKMRIHYEKERGVGGTPSAVLAKLPVNTGCQKKITKEIKGQDVNDRKWAQQKGNNRKTLGGTSLSVDCLRVPRRHRGGGGLGQWSEVEKKRGRRRERKRDTEIERLGVGGRELHSSPCSLNEVFFLFLRVRMVALGVDDGCVGVGRIVRSFGLVCQVRS